MVVRSCIFAFAAVVLALAVGNWAEPAGRVESTAAEVHISGVLASRPAQARKAPPVSTICPRAPMLHIAPRRPMAFMEARCVEYEVLCGFLDLAWMRSATQWNA
jgi:hypothetical protein